MASRVEGGVAGMTVVWMRLKAAGYQDLLQAATLRCFPDWLPPAITGADRNLDTDSEQAVRRDSE